MVTSAPLYRLTLTVVKSHLTPYHRGPEQARSAPPTLLELQWPLRSKASYSNGRGSAKRRRMLVVSRATLLSLVLIMSLLGGAGRAWGPLLGVIPLVLLSEFLAGTFPHHFGIALGLCFVVIVFYLPGGVARWLERVGAGRAGRTAA